MYSQEKKKVLSASFGLENFLYIIFFFSRQFILINLLNNKNTSEENYVHFIQFVLTIVLKLLIEKCYNQLENNS